MKGKDLRVAISVEHVRAWGRHVCEGIASFAKGRSDWSVTLFEDGLPSSRVLSRFDGFIWCVDSSRTAKRLLATGKPVIDLVNDGKYKGTLAAGANHMLCGQMAARHFITHRMWNFAFCGWEGLRFSVAREKAFVRAIRLNRYDCAVYDSPRRTLHDFIEDSVHRERLSLPSDAKEIGRWVRSLPKPVGVFCANDLRAWQLNAICKDLKIAVPGQVAILGADNDSVPCLLTNPTLSSVDTDTFGMGYRAAKAMYEILTGRLAAKDFVPIQVDPIEVESRESTAVYPVNPPWLADALVFIRENVARSLIASEVAAATGRAYVTVENAFKTKLGTTIQKEIMTSRLETAQHLLSATNRPLAETAKLSGFKSTQYFCLCFQRAFGKSPLAYRRSFER